VNEQTKEKVLAVEKLRTSGVPSIEACKRLKFPLASFYSYRRRALGLPKAYGKAPAKKQRRPYTKRSIPHVMNVTVPVTESSTISVVVLKGNTEAIREIVTGLGGVFRG